MFSRHKPWFRCNLENLSVLVMTRSTMPWVVSGPVLAAVKIFPF